MTTTTPIGEPTSAAPEPTAPLASDLRPRRRLGSWIGSPAAQGGATPSASQDVTVPLGSDQSPAPTIPLAHSTVSLDGPSSAPGSIDAPQPIEPASAAQAATVVLPQTTSPQHNGVEPAKAGFSDGATIPLASPQQTTPMQPQGDDTAMSSQAGNKVSSVPTGEERKLDALRHRVAENPADSDALFELAVALHRLGHRSQARDALARLVQLYQERGHHTQAARILSMLAGPKTETISTNDLPPRPNVSPTTRLATQATTRLSGATSSLVRETAAIGRAARGATKSLPNLPPPSFPPESLTLTIPLPGEDELPAEVRELLAETAHDLRHGRLKAAHDLCLYALQLAPDYTPLFVRIAEIYVAQHLTRRARVQGETLLRLAEASGDQRHLWMIYRLLLHTSENDLTSLRKLVELLIEAGRTELASLYASKLIQLLDGEGLAEEALGYSVRLCRLIPGDTRAALENVILLLRSGDRGSAVDRWETAVAAGADPIIAKASMAPMLTEINEDDHWRLLSDVLPVLRERKSREILEAYVRTAAILPPSTCHLTGHGLLLAAMGDKQAREQLATAAGDRNGSPMARAVSAIALADLIKHDGSPDEYVAAIRTAVKCIDDPHVAAHPAWEGLIGRIPRFEDLSLELGETLLNRGDAAGAVDILKAAHQRSRHHGPLCEKLAEAYFRIGQLGSALTVLDELAIHYRNTAQLEAMARVLRQMSQLAPNTIKVKSRLIDAYLQRGFVAEARAELIQRADLEERSGLIKDAVASLQRAADLSWTMGLADEAFALYHRMIDLAPDDVGLRHQLVNLYLQLGRVEDAAVHQRAVVDLALKQYRVHEAIAALHQVIGLTPDDTSAYYQLGDLLSSIGEYAQAEKVYKRLVLINPADAIAKAKATAMASLREQQHTQT
ncbi:MAG: hypothetical protein C4346_00490 [Chloroflexota bacterium]